jgi:hypothetical protein
MFLGLLSSACAVPRQIGTAIVRCFQTPLGRNPRFNSWPFALKSRSRSSVSHVFVNLPEFCNVACLSRTLDHSIQLLPCQVAFAWLVFWLKIDELPAFKQDFHTKDDSPTIVSCGMDKTVRIWQIPGAKKSACLRLCFLVFFAPPHFLRVPGLRTLLDSIFLYRRQAVSDLFWLEKHSFCFQDASFRRLIF